MVDKSKLTQYNFFGNENAPPQYLKSKTQLSKVGYKPIKPVAFIESNNGTIYLYDLRDPTSAKPKNKTIKNPIHFEDKSKPSHFKSSESQKQPLNNQKEKTSYLDSDDKHPRQTTENQEDFLTDKEKSTIEQIMDSAITLAFFFSGNPALMGLSFLTLLRASHKGKMVAEAGRRHSFAVRKEAEDRLCNLIKQKFTRPGMKIYAIQDYNYAPPEQSRMAEIILHLPPDFIFFITIHSLISTKGKTTKIYYNPTVDDLRFIKGKSRNQKFKADIIKTTHERAKWLRDTQPNLMPKDPIKIAVFASPKFNPLVTVHHHADTPLKNYGRHQFMFYKGIYIIEERHLITLIMKLTPKPEKKSSQ